MLEGEISEINLVERLVELWREQFTGAIRFEHDGIIKIVYFKGGDILSASTNDRSDSIDEILMRAGKVSREHVKQALAKRKESETLGDALLNLGFITRKELTWARRVQAVGVIRSIAAWTEGSFTIVADYLPKRDEGTLFSLPQVLVELVVTDQDRARFERALDGGRAVFAKTADFDEVWRQLGLNEDAERIVTHVDGSKNATEIAAASESDTFNVYKLLDALATLGILTRAAKPQVTPELSLDDFASAGVADASDLWSDSLPDMSSSPTFELDDVEPVPALPRAMPPPEPSQPAAEIPKATFEEEPPVSWNEQEEELSLDPEPSMPSRTPAWEAPPREALAVPIPVSIEPPAEAEEQWGFDEAQIETSRRATVPPVAPPAPRDSTNTAFRDRRPARRRSALPLILLVVAVLGAAGWYGFSWWQKQQASSSDDLLTRPAERSVARPVVPAGAPAATAPATDTAIADITSTTTDAAVPLTTGSAPASSTAVTPASTTSTPQPLVVTSPVSQPSANEPLAPVVPRNAAGRERYDEMARHFAANPQGNYAVQIQILCEPSNLAQALRAGGEQLWFVPQTIGARSCYRVFWGHFQTREEAQRAMATIPPALRDRSSAVKAVPKAQ